MRIARAFHRQADEYDRHAFVQKRVVQHLDRLMASHIDTSPDFALDIGCGTGALLEAMNRRYPLTSLTGLDLAFNMTRKSLLRLAGRAQLVNGDAGRLPFRDRTFDLVVSTSTFQWIGCLDICFKECRRVLKDNGLLCIAFFGEKTLWELRECYRQAVSNLFGADDIRIERMRRFKTSNEVRDLLSFAGYGQVTVVAETEIEYHHDVPELLLSIKGIGAATAAKNDSVGGLGWRKLLTEMKDIYRSSFEINDKIPATYEVLYVTARRQAD
jgi:malonyl-CoA O-methyltransferase